MWNRMRANGPSLDEWARWSAALMAREPGNGVLYGGRSVVRVTLQEMRLLLGLLLVLFLTSETWRYIGPLPASRFTTMLVLVLGLAVGTTLVGLRSIARPGADARVVWVARRRVLLEVVAFGGGPFLVFGALGAFTIDQALLSEWVGQDVDVWQLGPFALSLPLLQLVLFLGSVGSLAFAVEAVIDPETRAILLEDLLEVD